MKNGYLVQASIGSLILALLISPASQAAAATACTMEAKQCPDGSFVARTGVDCAFAPCPSDSPAKPKAAQPTY